MMLTCTFYIVSYGVAEARGYPMAIEETSRTYLFQNLHLRLPGWSDNEPYK